jgi:predicted Ser/Thr protein kinase
MNDREGSRSSVPSREYPGRSVSDDATVISAPESVSVGAGGSTAPRASESRSSTNDIGRILEGTVLGPYRLDRFIGGGGMGAVFQALDTSLHRTVAIKVLARHQSDDEENLRRFRVEAQSAARLDHENIGRVYAVGGDQGWHYIVLEYIEGVNLRDLVREEGPFDPGRTVDVAIQVAEALEHASDRNVVHRDIKPSNIVVTPAGRARIVDMGLARLHQVAGDAELTVSGMTLGTFDYISPEQARDPRDADVRSDLYSLGCTMFFLLAGRPPFAEGTMVQKLLQHQQAEPPAIDEIRRDVPRSLADVIARLMEKDPAQRYQRPAALVADLVACAEAEGYPLSAPRLAAALVPQPQPKASRLPWTVPVLLLALLVGVLWLRAAAVRQGEPEPLVSGGDASESVDGAGKETVTQPTVTVVRDAHALGHAITNGPSETVIDIDEDGVFDLASFSVAGRRMAIRATPGRTPVLRVSSGGDGIAIQVADGELSLSGVAVHAADSSGGPAGRRSLFAMSGGSLTCEDSILRMPRRRSTILAAEPAACIQVGESGTDGNPVPTVINFRGVRVQGDATVVAVESPRGGRVDIIWDTGVAVTRRLVTAEGARTGESMIAIRCTDLVASCTDGVVSLRDAPGLPRLPRLMMQATGCRFIVPDLSRALIEQSGIAEPDAYKAAVSWLDGHGRYEGTRIFQRIDGAAERVETEFGDPTIPFVHDIQVGVTPDPAAWEDQAG